MHRIIMNEILQNPNLSLFFDSSRMAFREEQRFRLNVGGEKRKAGRRMLVISTHGLTPEARLDLRRRYLETFARTSVSFPLKERATHLMTRIDERVFNFGRFVVNFLPRFRRKAYQPPRGRALEVVVALSLAEEAKLQEYLGNILRRRARTIGKFRMEGHQFSEGKIDRNRTRGGGHNCSSWIATAPIGPAGEPLLELLGGRREVEVATNPGWWTSWLAAFAPEERIPVVLHWTPEPLEVALAKLADGQNFEWNFNRH